MRGESEGQWQRTVADLKKLVTILGLEKELPEMGGK